MAACTAPLPKSCLTECLKRSQDSQIKQDVDKSIQSPVQIHTHCNNDGEDRLIIGSLSGSLFVRGGGCDILNSIALTPPVRPKNPIPRDVIFGTSSQEKYKNEVVQYTNLMNKCFRARNWLQQSESPGSLSSESHA
eukprot:TRINITY_DN6040_c0_g1_i1.p2 TRINITY_DN6040_c0_g1~~TRINITY_DN6040_c0_g1_i1.p2  ORF type:complete len:136 (-),score=2.56 TRINITY_DN6040_c0_g1_i1:983-1390(-)